MDMLEYVGGGGGIAAEGHKVSRATAMALGYWRSLRQYRGLPTWTDFDPRAIPIILPHTWLLDVENASSSTYRLRIFGSRLTQLCGRDLTGLTLYEALERERNDDMCGKLQDVARDRAPTFWRGPACVLDFETVAGFESLLLPFSTGGLDNRVDVVLGTTVCLDADDAPI